MQIGFRLLAIICMGMAFPAAGAGPDAVVAAGRAADIVVLGEIHDNPRHHAVQAEVVAALQPAALVFEMIPQAAEEEVNALRAQGAGRDAVAAALDWAGSDWPDFSYYWEILRSAPAARVFGAGQPSADVRRAMMEGAAGAFGPGAAAYGLDRPLEPPEQAAREALQAAAHCDALSPDMLPGMVEAQRFRDAGLADAALRARAMTGDGRVVVITGSGHADKARGIPAAIAIANPDVKVLSVGQFERPPSDAGDYDRILLAPAPERDDPCAGFAAE